MATVQEKIELLHEKLAKVKAGGGEKRVEKQHAQGKMTARERLAKLFDDNSFVELDQFVKHRCVNFGQEKKELPGEGVVTGYGTIDGRLVYAFAQDFTVEGGSLGEMHAAKIVKVQRLAMNARAGNTTWDRKDTRTGGAHPRSRGEHVACMNPRPPVAGSSPLARGTLHR